MKTLVGTFNQEKALVGAFSVITNLRIVFIWSTTGRGCGAAVSGPSWEHRKTAAWEQFWSISSFIHQLATRAEQLRRPAVTSRYHITLPHCNPNNDLTLADHSKYFHCIFTKLWSPDSGWNQRIWTNLLIINCNLLWQNTINVSFLHNKTTIIQWLE